MRCSRVAWYSCACSTRSQIPDLTVQIRSDRYDLSSSNPKTNNPSRWPFRCESNFCFILDQVEEQKASLEKQLSAAEDVFTSAGRHDVAQCLHRTCSFVHGAVHICLYSFFWGGVVEFGKCGTNGHVLVLCFNTKVVTWVMQGR